MPSHFDFPPTYIPDPESLKNNVKIESKLPTTVDNTYYYKLKIFQSSLNLLAHILIGCIVMISIVFAFRNALPLNATNLHIVLCVIGYHLLMAEAILSLSDDNGWSSRLKLMDKRRAHWVLQIMGSGMAIAGTSIKILDKNNHWTSLHGQFGLAALVFTVASLVNGFASLYSYEFRRLFNGNLSKISHVIFGTVAFTMASCCLCYGFDKGLFKGWATLPVANTMIAFVAILTFIVLINPLITFYKKSKLVIKTLRT